MSEKQGSVGQTIERMRFLDVFEEDQKETLTLKINLRVRDEDFGVGTAFRRGEKVAGVDFHLLRYFDFAVKKDTTGSIYEVKGFFPQK